MLRWTATHRPLSIAMVDSRGELMRRSVLMTSGSILAASLLVVPTVAAHAAATGPAGAAAAAQHWQLAPPGGAGPVATVDLDQAGALTLALHRGATQVLQPSALGIRTGAADLSSG